MQLTSSTNHIRFMIQVRCVVRCGGNIQRSNKKPALWQHNATASKLHFKPRIKYLEPPAIGQCEKKLKLELAI